MNLKIDQKEKKKHLITWNQSNQNDEKLIKISKLIKFKKNELKFWILEIN